MKLARTRPPARGHELAAHRAAGQATPWYVREGTAKLMTLFHPAIGEVRVKGEPSIPNKVLHPWLQQQIEDVLKGFPAVDGLPAEPENWLH
jgi:hypothetical protein